MPDEERHDIEQIPIIEQRRRALQTELIIALCVVVALAALIVVLSHGGF
jgi:hypothetical protein